MPTVQQLLNTVDTTYRNTYSPAQKVEWMDVTQRQIFQLVKHEASPFVFTTMAGIAFYPLPDDCDPMGIKRITIETKPGTEKYRDLRFVSIESNERLNEHDEFYSIIANQNIFLNPKPNTQTEGRKVYVYYNKRPAALSSANLSAIPDLEEDFHELLVLGCLERIARARGEYEDAAMFSADFNRLLERYRDIYDTPYPEYIVPQDKLPRRRGHVPVKGYRRADYGLLPSQYL